MIIRPVYSLVIAKRFLAMSRTKFNRPTTVILYTNNSTWLLWMPSTVKTLISLTTGANSRHLLLSCWAQYYSLSAYSAVEQMVSWAVYRMARPTFNGLNLKSINSIATQNTHQAQTRLYIDWLNLFTYMILLTARKATRWLQRSISLKKNEPPASTTFGP